MVCDTTEYSKVNSCMHNVDKSNLEEDFLCIVHDEETFEPCHEKTNTLVSHMVRHKPGCTATEDGYRLEILNLESRGIALSM